jgi:hypothetical protein
VLLHAACAGHTDYTCCTVISSALHTQHGIPCIWRGPQQARMHTCPCRSAHACQAVKVCCNLQEGPVKLRALLRALLLSFFLAPRLPGNPWQRLNAHQTNTRQPAAGTHKAARSAYK